MLTLSCVLRSNTKVKCHFVWDSRPGRYSLVVRFAEQYLHDDFVLYKIKLTFHSIGGVTFFGDTAAGIQHGSLLSTVYRKSNGCVRN